MQVVDQYQQGGPFRSSGRGDDLRRLVSQSSTVLPLHGINIDWPAEAPLTVVKSGELEAVNQAVDNVLLLIHSRFRRMWTPSPHGVCQILPGRALLHTARA